MINVEIVKREDQADGNFNNGEILEKNQLDFLKMEDYPNLTQIFSTGLMLGQMTRKVLLDCIHTKDLKYAALS